MPAPAPLSIAVAVFVHARPRHARQTLEGILKSSPEKLCIFADAARNESEREAARETRKIARELAPPGTEFIERDSNLGLAGSITSGADYVLERHEAAIFLEDDCVPAPSFMSFMRAALERYAEEESVAAVSGYGPPIEIPANYPYDAYFADRVSSWGWGTWRRAWRRGMRRDLAAALEEARGKGIEIARAGGDFRMIVEDQFKPGRKRDIWTPLWGIGAMAEGMRTLWPTAGFVRNIGFDGTGMHCGPTQIYETEISNQSEGFRFPPPGAEDRRISRRFRRFYDRQAPPRTFLERVGRRIASSMIPSRAPLRPVRTEDA